MEEFSFFEQSAQTSGQAAYAHSGPFFDTACFSGFFHDPAVADAFSGYFVIAKKGAQASVRAPFYFFSI
ncbi:MAG: hypothetical protein HFI65_08455 [Lachnospiraceae bacterium]|nr:hypothetical protein [Lachnospiraceae bacterium]